MSTDEANIHKLNSEFNYYYQTIVVTFYVENIVLITYIVYAIAILTSEVNAPTKWLGRRRFARTTVKKARL